MVNPGRQIGGECFHVGDSYVWAVIQYLDSPTDYREFLPQQPSQFPLVNSELVMLDSDSRGSAMDRVSVTLVLLISAVILLLTLYFEL